MIGLGLFCFALSSFTPTQRFGYLMFIMLTLSSIGNLVLMPALLAGPLGHFFWKVRKHKHAEEKEEPAPAEPEEERGATVALPLVKTDMPAIHHMHAQHPKRRVGS